MRNRAEGAAPAWRNDVAGQRSRAPVLDALSSAWAVGAVFVLYGLVHIALRLAFTDTLPLDDAIAAEMTQGIWALSYQARNPPLWEWLVLTSQSVLGGGPLAHLVIRYGAMVLIALAMRAVIAKATGESRLAAASAYGLVTFYWFGWHFHDFGTHTLLVVLICLVHLHLAMRWMREPSLGLALAIGVFTGLGLIAKWNFIAYVVALALAFASSPGTRRQLADWRVGLAGLVSAAIAAPVFYATWQLGGDIASQGSALLIGDKPYLERVLRGLSHLIVQPVLFFQLWIWIVLFALAGAMRRPAPPDPNRALLFRFSVIVAGGLLCGVLGLGVQELGARYLHPLGIPVAIAITIHAAAVGRGELLARRLFVAAPIVAGAVIIVRLVVLSSPSFPQGDANREGQPYLQLAFLLQEAGLGDAAFITREVREAGGLVSLMEKAEAVAIVTSRLLVPMSYSAERRCAVLWHAGARGGSRPEPAPGVPRQITDAVPEVSGLQARTFVVPWSASLIGGRRESVFQVIDLGIGSSACARYFGMSG